MSYVKPPAIIENMILAGASKANLKVKDLLIRGILSGMFLGYATTLAYTAAIQTKLNIIGALIFPVGFVMVVLLGLELVTGNFALMPLALFEGKINLKVTLRNWGWSFLGNLLGSILYALLFILTITQHSLIANKLIEVAENKTIGYLNLGYMGFISSFVKGILCNFMVTLGVVMAFSSESTAGKIIAMWLPILTFFGLQFEHSVVNMFVIPAGMLLGAKVSFGDWWILNQIPVTAGNLVGGVFFTALSLYSTHRKRN